MSSASSPRVLFVVGGIAFTVTAVRMTNALTRKAEPKRRQVLGDQ
ncbi:hypothetical protein QQM39_10470 [Streptomyces sp. DT2A-34]|nr:hypothetical protein [Streptomyces sp. DT2A-34]MDO0911262.1 hypothetical protein [Streptomyces sp. DT2A-34]